MDMSDNDRFELEKRNDTLMNFHSQSSMSSDWRFDGSNITSSSLGLVSPNSQVPVCRGNLAGAASCSSASMLQSFVPSPWDHSTNSPNFGLCDIIVQNNACVSNTIGIARDSLRDDIDGTVDMRWNAPNSMLKGGLFLPNASGLLPQSFSQFPADSAFIQRAARFSCFNGDNFSDMLNPFGIPESVGLYSRDEGMVQGPQEAFTGNELKMVSGGQVQKPILNMGEASKEASMSIDHVGGSPLKNGRTVENLVKSHDEGRNGFCGSANESDEADSNDGDHQDDRSMLEGNCGESSAKSLGAKKRRRCGQDTELDQVKGVQESGEVAKDSPEIQQKGQQNVTSTINKTVGKQGKQGLQASDPAKEEYIHVRARRGQATNSHSLAERVRREKISERMKFLQELVPGCSKVTGKAVMLDEIINYVQSLQRQVEFLSMKLATVNPRLDFSIEGQLAKDILQSRAIPTCSLAFSSEMPVAYPPLHLSQPGLLQAAFPGLGRHSDAMHQTINSQLIPMTGGFKESTQQLPNVWDNGLHNVVDRSYGASGPQDSQDKNGLLPPGHMKVEL